MSVAPELYTIERERGAVSQNGDLWSHGREGFRVLNVCLTVTIFEMTQLPPS